MLRQQLEEKHQREEHLQQSQLPAGPRPLSGFRPGAQNGAIKTGWYGKQLVSASRVPLGPLLPLYDNHVLD